MDAAKYADCERTAPVLRILWGCHQDRVPYRLGPRDDAVGNSRCDLEAPPIFLIDANGRCPVYGGSEVFQKDPYWRDLILFYEYFHGDDGASLGASHQTGWTGLVAPLLQHSGSLKATQSRAEGRAPFADAYQEVPSGGILP
jgi:hypothetical protein